MKIFIFIFLVSITLGICRKKSHKLIQTTLSDTNSGGDKNITDEKETALRNSRRGLVLKGILRQSFALETAFADTSENVVCSPVSALLPLGKLALGAEDLTQRELFQMVGVTGSKELSKSFKKTIKNLQYLPGVKLDIASRIYVSDKAELKSKFLKASKDIFHSGVETVSFKNPKNAADEINGWVSRQTKGMIPLLIRPEQISPLTSLILVNAIYFKGRWKDPFKNVGVSDFFAPSGQKKVQMMSRSGGYNHVKSSLLNAQIIEIPYEGIKASFVIVLPNNNNGLPMLLNQLKLAPKLLNNALSNLEPKTVKLTIPKFTITTTLDLKDMYKKIGMKHLFSQKSGLTGIVKGEELSISSAIQKAVIEVHERGTEAAAASAAMVIPLSQYLINAVFNADHPFLFYIRAGCEQLFAGAFIEP